MNFQLFQCLWYSPSWETMISSDIFDLWDTSSIKSMTFSLMFLGSAKLHCNTEVSVIGLPSLSISPHIKKQGPQRTFILNSILLKCRQRWWHGWCKCSWKICSYTFSLSIVIMIIRSLFSKLLVLAGCSFWSFPQSGWYHHQKHQPWWRGDLSNEKNEWEEG